MATLTNSSAGTTNAWSFAAAAEDLSAIPNAIAISREICIDRHFVDNERMQKQIRTASLAVADLLATNLWGSGPFSVALSGNERGIYISVVTP
jgi:hypothetical protein